MPDVTVEQEENLGYILADHIGDHFQTGWDSEELGIIYVYAQKGPNLSRNHYLVYPSGLVVRNGLDFVIRATA